MTTEERLEKVEPEQACGKRRSRWTFWRLVVLVMAVLVLCRIVVMLAMCSLLVVRGQQSHIQLEAMSDPAWWGGQIGEVLGLSVWGILLVGSFAVVRDNAMKWRAGTHAFGTVVCIIMAAPVFLVAFLGLVAWVFGFWLGDLVRVIWHAP